MIFIIKGLRTIVFIIIIISTTLRRLFNPRVSPVLIPLTITESEQVTDVESIKDVVRSSVKVPAVDKHL